MGKTQANEESEPKGPAKIEDLLVRKKETNWKLWEEIRVKAENPNAEARKEAIRLILQEYPKLPWEEATLLIMKLADKSQPEEVRIFLAGSILELHKCEIPYGLYSDLIATLDKDPSEKVRALIEGSPLIKSARILETQLGAFMLPAMQMAMLVRESFMAVQLAVSTPTYMNFEEASRILEQSTATMTALHAAISAYPAIFTIAHEEIQQLKLKVPPFIEGVVTVGQKEEGIEEIDEMITELQEHAENVGIFKGFEQQIHEGVEAFERGDFNASFGTLLNVVEGVTRAIYVGEGLGGTNESLIPMTEKLKSEKYILYSTAGLTKSLDRDRADHALWGEYREFPEQYSRLVILSLFKIARDYIYFKIMRKCLENVTKTPAYQQFTVNNLLSLYSQRKKLHVERKFENGELKLTLTLFDTDVFEFISTGPKWNSVSCARSFRKS